MTAFRDFGFVEAPSVTATIALLQLPWRCCVCVCVREREREGERGREMEREVECCAEYMCGVLSTACAQQQHLPNDPKH